MRDKIKLHSSAKDSFSFDLYVDYYSKERAREDIALDFLLRESFVPIIRHFKY